MADHNPPPGGDTFLGKGWSFPPTFERQGRALQMVDGEVDIRQSLEILLATSLVADLQLIAAAVVWAVAVHVSEAGMTPSTMAAIVSLAGGALVANIISVTILVAETLMMRR